MGDWVFLTAFSQMACFDLESLIFSSLRCEILTSLATAKVVPFTQAEHVEIRLIHMHHPGTTMGASLKQSSLHHIGENSHLLPENWGGGGQGKAPYLYEEHMEELKR